MTKNNDDEQVILEFGVQTFTLTDYTRYQEMVLMRIIKACQSDISDAITSYKNNNILVFSKEENSEQVRHRRLKAPGTQQDALQQTEEGLDRDVEQTDWHTLSPAFDCHPVHVV